ncbi:hypothetical protein HK096_010022 [Nowakowskiella sp. JEL0078]|nr:hypothetical protein HK096_010022 [Nowakowskiella sp. JEL0078]
MSLPVYAGRFRRRVYFDIFGSLTVGIGAASYWWFGIHMPADNKWRAHTANVKIELDKEYAEWKAAQN